MLSAITLSRVSSAVRIPSVHGSAPKKPPRSLGPLAAPPASSSASARKSAYEGVLQRTVEPRSWKTMSWRSVNPPEIGITAAPTRSEEHTSELQSQSNLVCRLLLEKKHNTAILFAPERAPASPARNPCYNHQTGR